MKNSIIQSSIANIVFLLGLLAVILFLVVPKVSDITIKKQELASTYTKYQDTKKSGISFQELRQAVSQYQLNDDAYTSTLLQNIDVKFYNDAFSNTWSTDFFEYLDEKELEIRNIKASEKYIQKDITINSILPIYTQDIEFWGIGLNDFHFINYIEKIIYTFNLSADGSIGIWDIEKVGAESSDDPNAWTQQNTLQEDIFKIPLDFKVTGQKWDIVEFLHFFENVWSVNVDGEDLKIHADNFISKSIEGDKKTASYNIYKNQIADISFVWLQEYPDSSALASKEKLISLMKTEQAREKITLELELNFYVAWVPGYRMEVYVRDVVNSFNDLSWKIASDSINYTKNALKYNKWVQLQAIQKLQSLNATMLAQKKEVNNLQIQLSRKDGIQKTYEDAIKLWWLIEWIDNQHAKQIEVLTKEF